MAVTPKAVELQTVDPAYPWQSLVGDGCTLVILRQKIKTQEGIGNLSGVVKEEFNWSLFTPDKDNRLYKGNIKFEVSFKEAETENLYLAADEDEHIFYTKLDQPSVSLGAGDNRIEAPTVFPSLIFTELTGEKQPETADTRKYSAEIPWQVWLYGSGQEKEPQLIKVHLAQVGLKTLLLEVVLRLETGEQPDLQKIRKEELVITLQGASIMEIIGLGAQRFLYDCRRDPTGQNLIIENMKRIWLVYVHEQPGGERLLAASFIIKEKNKIPFSPLPPVQPAHCVLSDQGVEYVLVDADKILYKAAISSLIKLTEQKSEEQETGEEEPNQSNTIQRSTVAVSSLQPSPSSGQVVTLQPRPKPGEKWLKKEVRPGIRPASKTVLSIRL